MRCEDIMKKNVACVSPRDSVQKAALKMLDEGVGFLPVCDDHHLVVGTITDRDITLRVVAAGSELSTPVGEVMTREVVSCGADDSIAEAERKMSWNRKSRLIVTDESGLHVGVISLSDLAQLEPVAEAGRTLQQITEREASAIN